MSRSSPASKNDGHTADIALFTLDAISVPGGVLLRGARSILSGEIQNDLDLWVPTDQIELAMSKMAQVGSVRVMESLPTQKKICLDLHDHKSSVFIDLFSQVTWRGLEIVDIQNLPTEWLKGLPVATLSGRAAAWLTAMKNSLHGSETPTEKLGGYTVDNLLNNFENFGYGPVKGALMKGFERSAISYAFAKQSKFALFKLRLAFVLSALWARPVTSVTGFFSWLLSKTRGTLE